MIKRKIAAFLLAFSAILNVMIPVSAAPSPTPSPSASPIVGDEAQASEIFAETEEQKNKTFPEPRAKAAILYDLKGSRLIYEYNKSEQMYPASLTNIMTALLLLENGNLEDTATVTESSLADITYLHSKLNLKVGEQIKVEDLLKALLVCSANDCANVIAEYVSGDIGSFVELMNQRAKELGMESTHFANPHGFHDPNHYSSANDILLMTKEALKHDKFKEIVKIKTTTLPATNISEERFISSTNHLISRYRNKSHLYQYATGIKTGHTDEAGYCLVSSAEKNGTSLLAIVLGCENENADEGAYSFVDSKNMFEYVFDNYKTVTVATTQNIVSDSDVYESKDSTRVALSPSKDVCLLLPKDYDASKLKTDIKLPEKLQAPIELGSAVGSVTYSYEGETPGTTVVVTVDLIAANEVKRDHMLHFAHNIADIVFSPFVIIPLLLVIFFVLMNAYNQSKRRKTRRKRMKSQSKNRQPSYKRTSSKKRSTTPKAKQYDPWDKYR